MLLLFFSLWWFCWCVSGFSKLSSIRIDFFTIERSCYALVPLKRKNWKKFREREREGNLFVNIANSVPRMVSCKALLWWKNGIDNINLNSIHLLYLISRSFSANFALSSCGLNASVFEMRCARFRWCEGLSSSGILFFGWGACCLSPFSFSSSPSSVVECCYIAQCKWAAW